MLKCKNALKYTKWLMYKMKKKKKKYIQIYNSQIFKNVPKYNK